MKYRFHIFIESSQQLLNEIDITLLKYLIIFLRKNKS